MSFAASANVIARLGAVPRFVDIELASRNINMDLAEAALGAKTRAIMPVHFSGLPVDMHKLLGFAEKHGLRVVEDAAHAIGSRYENKPIGSFGDMTVFSFHPNKNMTSIEGGAIAVAAGDRTAVELIEQHRFHGIKRNADGDVDVLFPGGKSNLSDVAAQVGLDQLRRLDGFNARRRELVGRYFDDFADYRGAVLPARGDAGHSWHMFQLLIDFRTRNTTRAAFQKAMAARGIGIGVHYPCIPGLAYYRDKGYEAERDYPVAARVGRETVTLPLFPAMQDEDVARVCTEIRAELG
jgi:dTDP-4-amino-4,6-dideoxygalactose transaminase